MTKKTQELVNKLRTYWPHPDKAIIFEFRGGTGWSVESRADAIAMDLWPSNGLELVGFEIKTSRQDWLKELKNPLKADPIKRFCDKWYLIVDDETICKWWEELPKDWGMMVVDYTGKLVVKKEAPQLESEPIDRFFLASLMRIASRPFDEVIINGKEYQIKK